MREEGKERKGEREREGKEDSMKRMESVEGRKLGGGKKEKEVEKGRTREGRNWKREIKEEQGRKRKIAVAKIGR